jgi:hypothetical protein
VLTLNCVLSPQRWRILDVRKLKRAKPWIGASRVFEQKRLG